MVFSSPCFLALERFVDGSADGVAGFRRGEDALGAGKILRRLEYARLLDAAGLHQTVVVQLGQNTDSCRGSAGRLRDWPTG